MRILSALANVDNSTNSVNCGTGTRLANLNAGTVMFWALITDVNNAVRNLAGKTVSGGGWEVFKRAGDGTQLRFGANRATASHTVDTPTGTLIANEPFFMAMSWDRTTTSNAKILKGTLRTPAADVGATVAAGSGAANDDSASALRLLANSTPSAGWPGVLWTFGVWARVGMPLDEIRDQQRWPRPTSGCVGFWYVGRHGRGVTWDASGYANHGRITGLTVQSAALPGIGRIA